MSHLTSLRNYASRLKQKYLPEKKFRKPRVWSNQELKKLAPLCAGSVINVSGWVDSDKEGGFYKDYFSNATSYAISNYPGERGFQGDHNEIALDLEKELPEYLKNNYDVVFNHTTLEHIFDVQKAFENLCLLSKDLVIVVVPFMQEQHYNGSFKDYWRFTPFALEALFNKNGLELVYISGNNKRGESVYVLAIGSKKPANWKQTFVLNRSIFKNLGNHIIR
jgi:hypothetical protein